jgi:translocation and assembly module TamB
MADGGTLYGQVDLDDFSPTTIIDLTLDLDNLQFMNNPYDPDIPFYASLYGTGQARITGTNFSPFLRTSQTVNISSNSRISIPLEEETEFEQDRRFIQFVDTFDLAALARRASDESGNGNGDTPPEELTFIERFTMDLNFTANNPVNVQLIFDRVTNEVLNANGTGQVRILLEDQDVSMFGRFNIQSGDYQFVSGDIFTRRFTLQEGGSISWQGDLTDANLNVTALYRARPLISSLVPSARAAETAGTGRIPIELVLQIGGTITEVENDFFFRVPTGIEGTLDPTIATQINNLNQNEEQKLIQATSILLSGNFLPTDSAQNFAFADGVTGTAAVVNPLLTSQVINPLLSNQINSLLRSDITFDIDLNLTAFNEVDLGVALRLFDDRVILRREGQIGGQAETRATSVISELHTELTEHFH